MSKTHSASIAIAASATLGFFLAPSVDAAVIAYDNFGGYTVGTSLGTQVTASDGTGWTGQWINNGNYATAAATVVTSPGNFVVPSGTATFKAASLNGSSTAVGGTNSNELDFRQLSAPVSVTGASPSNPISIYFSFIIQRLDTNSRTLNVALYGNQFDATGSNPAVNTNDLFDVALSGGGPNWSVNYYTTVLGNAGGNGVSTTATSTQSGAVLTAQQLVLEMDYRGGSGNDSYELYYNPANTSATPIIQTTGLSIQTQYLIDAVRLFAGNSTGYDVSDITLATSFADVVPEPSTLAMTTVCSFALLRRRARPAP